MKRTLLQKRGYSASVGRKRTIFYQASFLLLVLILLLLLVGFIFIPMSVSRWVPYPLHSMLRADYSADASAAVIPRMSLGLIFDTFSDMGTPVAWGGISTLQVELMNPVPSVTPDLVSTATPST